MSFRETAAQRADRLFQEGSEDVRMWDHVAWQSAGLPETLGSVDVGELEPLKGISPRETRDKMIATMRQHGATREWAEQRTGAALKSWDRGVRGGSIKTKK